MRFVFITKHRHIWPVSWLCEVLEVSRSGFHAWLNRPTSIREIEDAKLVTAIETRFKASDRTYGARRFWRDVLDEGFACGLHRIERLMRINALRARPKRRRKPKDDGERSVIADNILDRDFQADRPNQKWLADFTYIWTAEGWLYVAVVLDLFSRRAVGWSMKADRDASLVMDALMMVAGVPIPLALMGALAIGAGCGFVNGALIGWGGLQTFIVTLGDLSLYRALALIYTGVQPIFGLPDDFRALTNGTLAGFPTPVIIVAVLAVWPLWRLGRLWLG